MYIISKFQISLLAALLFSCSTLFAQTAITIDSNKVLTTQKVMNAAVTNPDALIVTGKIVDAITHKPIQKTKINFDKFGEELMQASIDANGNYALALNRKELGEPVRIIFKVEGYKKFVAKGIDKRAQVVDVDIYLMPEELEEISQGSIKYVMNDSPFNPLVLKMQ